VRLPPPKVLAKAALHGARRLTRAGKVARDCLVEHDFAIDRDLEDALHPGAKLDSAYDGSPPRRDLDCRTDSLVEVVSRDAVFDDDGVLRVNHLEFNLPCMT
jgi:hypothetical protein